MTLPSQLIALLLILALVFSLPAKYRGALVLLVLAVSLSTAVFAAPTALDLMQRVEMRAEGPRQQARLEFVLSESGGATQTRSATAFREIDQGSRRMAIYFDAPASLRGTAFLSWVDEARVQDDEQWLYLPALRRTRRVPGRDRGGYFLGTDLSYDDLRRIAKVATTDWHFESVVAGSAPHLRVVEGRAATPEIAKELGYSHARWVVDVERAFVLEAEYRDLQDQPFKSIRYEDVAQQAGVWTPGLVRVHNLKTGHRTELRFADVSNEAQFDAQRLTPQGLERGP